MRRAIVIAVVAYLATATLVTVEVLRRMPRAYLGTAVGGPFDGVLCASGEPVMDIFHASTPFSAERSGTYFHNGEDRWMWREAEERTP